MKGPVRVLHVVVNMNRGGAETLLMNLYRNIDLTTVQFDFLTCKEGVYDEEIKQLGGRVHRIPYVTDKGHFGYIKSLNKFFATNQEYRIVHSHMDRMSGIVLKSAKKNNVPIRIAHSHTTNSEGNFVAKFYKWYAGQLILPNATHLAACSSAAAEWLFKEKANDAVIIKNGIDCKEFFYSHTIRKKVRDQLEYDNNKLVIGHVGRFNKVKNHSFIIELFAALANDLPEARLVLIGDGPLREEIEQKIKSLNLIDKVKILGIRKDINLLLQGFDIFLFPSLHEGLPVTLIEAQGASLPCVISDVITKEVDLGMNLISFCSLNDDNAVWVEKLKEILTVSNPREKANSQILKNDYDIKNTAQWTKQFYLAI